MTFEEFLAKILETGVYYTSSEYTRVLTDKGKATTTIYSVNQHRALPYTWRHVPTPPVLSVEWIAGGTRKTCWSNKTEKVPPEPEPELTGLDEILEAVVPNITYLQYRKLLPLVTVREWRTDDYYNSYDKKAKELSLRNLYDKLVELKLIEGES